MADRKMTLEALRALAREIDRHVKAGGVTSPQAAVPMRGQQQQQQNPGARPLVVTLRVVDETGSGGKTRAGRDAAEAKRKKARGESAVERIEKRRAESDGMDYLQQIQTKAGFHSSVNPLRNLPATWESRGLHSFGALGQWLAHKSAIAARNGSPVGQVVSSGTGIAASVAGAAQGILPALRGMMQGAFGDEFATWISNKLGLRDIENGVNDITSRIAALEVAKDQTVAFAGAAGSLAAGVSKTAKIDPELAAKLPAGFYDLARIQKQIDARKSAVQTEAGVAGVVRSLPEIIGNLFRK